MSVCRINGFKQGLLNILTENTQKEGLVACHYQGTLLQADSAPGFPPRKMEDEEIEAQKNEDPHSSNSQHTEGQHLKTGPSVLMLQKKPRPGHLSGNSNNARLLLL